MDRPALTYPPWMAVIMPGRRDRLPLALHYELCRGAAVAPWGGMRLARLRCMSLPAQPLLPSSGSVDTTRVPGSAPFLLREFGVPALEDADGTVRQRGGKPLLLLLWLLHSAPRRASRDEVCHHFWPDDPPENARRSLRQALVQHRRWLGTEAICTDEDLVWIAPGVVQLESRLLRDAIRDMRADVVWASYREAWAVDAERVGGDRLEPWVLATRESLADSFTTFAIREVREASAIGDLGRARTMAAAAAAVEPSREALVVLHAETLIAVGAFAPAREALDRFVASTVATGESVSGPIRRLHTRLSASTQADASSDGHRPGERLVARDMEIATIWRALALARGGRPQRVLITGEPGLGKTRLLDEVEARLQTYALQIVRVRVTGEMRAMRGTALVLFVRALAARRGASGVSAGAAAVLVRLAPELVSLFAGAPVTPDRPAAEIAAAAIAELLEVVADERATVLLVDDLHLADPWSQEVWRAVSVSASVSLLEVAVARSGIERLSLPDATPVELAPFGPADVRELLSTVAVVPEAPWMEELVSVLATATRGTPRTLLRALRTLEVQGALMVRGGTWTAMAADTLPSAVATAVHHERAVAGEDATRLLRALAAWGGAVPEDRLLRVAEACWPARGRLAWSQALETLERDGVAWRRGDAWLAEGDAADLPSGTARAASEECGLLLTAFGDALFSEPVPPSATDLEQLVRRAGSCEGYGVAAALVRRLARGSHLRRLGLPRSGLARHVSTLAGQPRWERGLRRAMGFVGRRSRRSLLGLGAAAALMVALLGGLLAAWQPRLVIEVLPMPDNGGDAVEVGMAVQPRVAVRDGFGRLRLLDGVPVRVRGKRVRVLGDTVRESEAGRVQYEELHLRPGTELLQSADASSPFLEFTGPWWMRSLRVELPGLWWLGGDDHFRLVKASMNGRPVDAGGVATLRPGEDSVEIVMTFEFSTLYSTANYIVGAAPLWLPRESSSVRVTGLPRPVVRAWSSVRFTVPAPREPGRHALLVVMGAEESVEHLLSSTNWLAGAPRWYDGNDLHDLSAAERAILRDSGSVKVRGVLIGRYRRPRGQYVGIESERVPNDSVVVMDRPVRGTALEVIVGRGR